MQRAVAFCFFLLTFASSVSAQLLSFGVKGGVPLNTPYGQGDASRLYVVGPSVEVRLPAGFAVEAGALYQRTGYDAVYFYSLGVAVPPIYNRVRGNSWQFPILGKYYFRRDHKLQPFAGTGYAFRTAWLHTDIAYDTVSAGQTTRQNFSVNSRSPLDVSVMAAAGVRWRAGRHVSILPEIRYNRWGSSDFQTRKNGVTFLLGFTFR